MSRYYRPSLDEARERKIAELTEQLFQSRLAKIGEPAVLRDVSDSVFDYLSSSDDQYKLTAGEITFTEVRDRVMRNEAEVAAIKAVERMEQQREEDAQRNRIERVAFDRAFA